MRKKLETDSERKEKKYGQRKLDTDREQEREPIWRKKVRG